MKAAKVEGKGLGLKNAHDFMPFALAFCFSLSPSALAEVSS
jgi:hypothetical protein